MIQNIVYNHIRHALCIYIYIYIYTCVSILQLVEIVPHLHPHGGDAAPKVTRGSFVADHSSRSRKSMKTTTNNCSYYSYYNYY